MTDFCCFDCRFYSSELWCPKKQDDINPYTAADCCWFFKRQKDEVVI
jgi:hypothetical protein